MKSINQARREILSRPQTDDLIQDLLPDSSQAYMLICGRSGIGKTFLALNILYCLATGTPFLSHKTKTCNVGYLSMEGSDVKILKRFDTYYRYHSDRRWL
jgi:RecA-family ATPase